MALQLHYVLVLISIGNRILLIDGSLLGPNQRLATCTLTIPVDLPRNEPVYLTNTSGTLQLFDPCGSSHTFKLNDSLFLFCPGRDNRFNHADGNMTQVVCNADRKIKAVGLDHGLANLRCSRGNTGALHTTNESCARGVGHIQRIGFRIDAATFVSVIDICFDNRTASLIWAKNVLDGDSIKYHVRESRRREFSSAGVPVDAQPKRSYARRRQVHHFRHLLGADQLFVSDKGNGFLSRGHMAPDADFVFSSAQFATYFYANVVPQFQTVNGGNWLRVEQLTRQLAERLNDTLTVYTGVYGQLQLPHANKNGTLIPVALAENGMIPVPLWTWKAVLFARDRSAIVLLTQNNPYAQPQEIRDFCVNVCTEAGIHTAKLSDARKGYTICCRLDDFRQFVKTLPNSVRGYKLLRFGGTVTKRRKG